MNGLRYFHGRATAAQPVLATRSLSLYPASLRPVWAKSGTDNIEKAILGEDFGARDPFAAELESNFCEKVLGNYDTDHLIKAPESIGDVMGLKAQRVGPQTAEPLGEGIRERFRNQVPGWRCVSEGSAGLVMLRHEWEAQDEEKANALCQQVQVIASQEGHLISLKVEGAHVTATLTGETTGGLSMNDFIVAAKINELDMSKLLRPRKARYWA